MSATQSNSIYNGSGTASNSGLLTINGTTQSNSQPGQVLTVSGTSQTIFGSVKATYHILGEDYEV